MAHLTRSQRDQMQALKRAKHKQKRISEIIGCSQSTVSRELKRNSSLVQNRYTASKAQKKAEARRQRSYESRSCWYEDDDLLKHVEEELIDGKSPDQIAGRMKQQGRKHTVSHQSIYNYIEQDKEEGGNLHLCLRYQGKKYKWRGLGSDKTKIPNRNDISERPEEVDSKERSGDWESDLVVSNKQGKGAVATFSERTCLCFRAVLVEDQSSDEMVRASCDALGEFPEKFRLTMTHDNGGEISKHEQITEELKMTVYCANPYRSCDRGLNEWYNRELRRFFPKGTDFSTVTQEEVDAAVDWLNNCPRRSLGYLTPNEAYHEKLENMHFTV